MGKYVYVEPMIPAEISPPARSRPALSGVIIRIADFDVTNIGNDTDLILASHEIVLDRRLDDGEYNQKCVVLLDMGDRESNPDSYEMVLKRCTKEGISVIPFDVDDVSKTIVKEMGGKGQNLYYLGMLAYIYNMDEEIVKQEIKIVRIHSSYRMSVFHSLDEFFWKSNRGWRLRSNRFKTPAGSGKHHHFHDH